MAPRASSSSSSSSYSPVPTLPTKKRTKKSTSKPSIEAAIDSGNKNEGIPATWPYSPPDGAVLLDKPVDAGPFDWDAIQNDDQLELWLIRVPDSVKPKHLQDVTVSSSSTDKNGRVGTLKRKYTSFDLVSVEEAAEDDLVGGEETKALSCLLPRNSKKGRLYHAPRPIARHLVLAARPVKPTPPSSSHSNPALAVAASSSNGGSVAPLPLSNHDPLQQFKKPPRQRYPKELLKHRFVPYGATTAVVEDVEMAVEGEDNTKNTVVESPAQKPTKPTKTAKKLKTATNGVSGKEAKEKEVKERVKKRKSGEDDGEVQPTKPKKARKAK